MPIKWTHDFWKRVNTAGSCWLWTGTTRNGYGRLQRDGRVISAHVYAYETEVGPVPKGKVVRHRCNNRGCVRPSHLRLGSQRQNVLDSVRAGTHKNPIMLGEAHPNSRLTAHDVQKARELHKLGVSSEKLGKQFGVSGRHMRKVLTGARWKGPEGFGEALQRSFVVD